MSSKSDLKEDINIKITQNAYLKMKYFTLATDEEVGGFLIINDNRIEDVIILKQEISYADFELDEDALDKFVLANLELMPKIKGWWHSHGKSMSTFYSYIDDNTIKRLMENQDFLISVVANHKMDLRFRVDFKHPFFSKPLKLDDVRHTIIIQDNGIRERCQKEVDRLCTEKQTTYEVVDHFYKNKKKHSRKLKKKYAENNRTFRDQYHKKKKTMKNQKSSSDCIKENTIEALEELDRIREEMSSPVPLNWRDRVDLN